MVNRHIKRCSTSLINRKMQIKIKMRQHLIYARMVIIKKTTNSKCYQGYGEEGTLVQCYCSVSKSCPTICNPMNCSTPGFPVPHNLPEFAQTHVYWVGDAIQPSHPLSSPSPPAFNLPQHQDLFKWVGSSLQVAKVLMLQLQHQSFQWIFRSDFL